MGPPRRPQRLRHLAARRASDTYSRPPLASNGCIALTNEDFTAISREVQIGHTPVIIANSVDWVEPEASAALRRELAQRVESWRRDWESRDTEQYLAHYAGNFTTGKMRLAQWSKQKRKVNTARPGSGSTSTR